MDRWIWLTGGNKETAIIRQHNIRIYDGEDKTSFEDGFLKLTPTSLIWQDSERQECTLCLALSLVVRVERTAGGIGKSPKIILHLTKAPSNKPPGPVGYSKHSFIRLSFKSHGDGEFYNRMMSALKDRAWEHTSQNVTAGANSQSRGSIEDKRKFRAGIVGIERKIEERRKETEENISVAFQDLTKLIEKAKEMVTLSQAIATKIKDKQGDITEDETVKFKSYLLSLGIPNPVTKETHGSGTHYHMQLAREICAALESVLQSSGGIILISDAYCRINRARGMEHSMKECVQIVLKTRSAINLLSPEDMMNACRMMENMQLPMKMRTYDSGVTVLQLQSHSEESAVKQTVQLVEESNCLTAEQLSNILAISVLLAKERLLLAEKKGKLCRDDSVEGLSFYPNLFLTNTA